MTVPRFATEAEAMAARSSGDMDERIAAEVFFARREVQARRRAASAACLARITEGLSALAFLAQEPRP